MIRGESGKIINAKGNEWKEMDGRWGREITKRELVDRKKEENVTKLIINPCVVL